MSNKLEETARQLGKIGASLTTLVVSLVLLACIFACIYTLIAS